MKSKFISKENKIDIKEIELKLKKLNNSNNKRSRYVIRGSYLNIVYDAHTDAIISVCYSTEINKMRKRYKNGKAYKKGGQLY